MSGNGERSEEHGGEQANEHARGRNSGGTAGSAGAGPSLRAAGALALEIVETRLALLAVELEEHGVRLARIALLAAGSLFCLGVAIVLGGVMLVLWVPDNDRLTTLGALSACALVAGVILYAQLRRNLADIPALFAGSLEALRKDRAGFRS